MHVYYKAIQKLYSSRTYTSATVKKYLYNLQAISLTFFNLLRILPFSYPKNTNPDKWNQLKKGYLEAVPVRDDYMTLVFVGNSLSVTIQMKATEQ